MAFNYSPKIVTDGLVLCLDAANPRSYASGSTSWLDLSRSQNNGGLVNGPTFNSANGGSIVFDGVDDYTIVSNSTSLQVGATFSINCWIKTTILSSREAIFSTRGTNAAGSWMLEVGPANSNTNTVAITGVGTWIFVAVNNSISLNTWTNICFVRPNNSVIGNMYINGASVNSQQTTSYSITNNSDSLYVGISRPGAEFFNGNISTVYLYNRALSAQEIQQNYNALKGRYGL